MNIRNRIKSLKRIKASQLRPNPHNWRKHPQAQHDAMRGILAEVGYVDAILVRELDDNSYEIVDGHLRAEITPDAEVPVLVLDINADEAIKVLATFDLVTSMAECDPDKLRELLSLADIEAEATKQMLVDYLDDQGNVVRPVSEDDVPAPPDVATTRPGDIWILGNHRLMCGDSSQPKDLDRLLAGAVIHLVNTDPPYNVKVEPRSNNAIAAGLSSFQATHHQGLDVSRHPGKAKPTGKKLRAKDRPLANDFVSDEEFDRLLAAWFGNMARVLNSGRSFYIWGGYANCANYPPVLKAVGFYFSQAIIWHKQHPVLTRKDFMGDHEWCFYGWKEGAAHEFFGPNNVPDVWPIKKVNPQSMVHLTEKPVELAARAMQYSSRPGEHVLDLFGGSGSTLIGAEQTDRKAFLMELDPPYCDVIVERFERLTGKKAERLAAAEVAP